MAKGILFGNIHSHKDLSLILSKVDLPPAAVKTNFVDNPGGDGSWDLTEANGKVNYKDRTAKFTFSVLPEDDFEEKKTEVSNLLNGRRFKITLDKDPEYYWDGRCSVNQYSSNKKKRQIVIGATVAPYKLKQEQTRVFVPFSGRNLFNNAELPKIGGSSANIESIATGVRATWVQGKSAYVLVKWLPLDMLIGETITLSCDIVESGGAKGTIQIGYAAASGSPRQSKVKLESTGAVSFTVEKTNPQFEYLAIWFYANNGTDPANVTAGAYVDYLNLQIELGEVGEDQLFSSNLIPLPYASGGIGDVITRDGITWTVNNDGSVSASGTAMRNTSFMLLQSGSFGDKSGYGSSHDRVESLNGFVIKHCDYNSNSGAVYIYINQGTTVKKTFYPMLNEGSIALPYEPYWRGYEPYFPYGGKNLCGGDFFADIIMNQTKDSAKDETAKTVKFYAREAKNFVLLSTFKENTVYSVFIKGYTFNGTTPSDYSNIRIFYTDGSNTDLRFDEAVYQTPSFKVFITDANKTISQIKGNYSTGATVLYYEECGIFEGVLTEADFVPFNAPAEITLTNGRKTVVPTLICTTETKFDVGGLEFTLSEGKHKMLDFQLTEGETNVSLHGEDGAAAIVYQEGDL